MNRKPSGPHITGITYNDGLADHDLIDHDAKNAPNSSDHERFREYYETEFRRVLAQRDAFAEDLLEKHSTGKLDIGGLHELMISAPERPLYFAAKYLLHRRLVDRFQELGHTFSMEREIYLLGATWAEARFMVNFGQLAAAGRASARARETGRKVRNSEAVYNAKLRYAEWQKQAELIWQDRPELSNAAVARIIVKRGGDDDTKPETIAKKIVRPK